MQDALYAQGRQPLNVVNQMRHQVGLSSITPADNRGVVTYARGGETNHNRRQYLFAHGRAALDIATGYAVDIVDKRYGWNPPNHRFWEDLGQLAKKHGCVWGGDWKGNKRDVAHIQMKLIDSPLISTVVA